MNIIFVGKFRGRPLRCQLGNTRQTLFCLTVLSMLLSVLLYSGYWFGQRHANLDELERLHQAIAAQKALIQQTRLNAGSDMDALASRVGMMQASVLRLNALGERLVRLAGLDSAEFDFNHPPSVGGPHEAGGADSLDFDHIIQTLNEELLSRQAQLEVLEGILIDKQLKTASRPTGKPIVEGWTSSFYGKRTDPFTGKLAMHKGMDFAGKEGSEIIAVADGVVTWAGKRYGYGQLVEISHGNGFATRYGHNEKILVSVGDNVRKGQVISLMGSTGRSTGPHVHFEVLKNDRQVDPARYVAENRR